MRTFMITLSFVNAKAHAGIGALYIGAAGAAHKSENQACVREVYTVRAIMCARGLEFIVFLRFQRL